MWWKPRGNVMTGRLALCFEVVALCVYVIGGISTFGGVALIFFMNNRDLWGWGTARPLGYLFLCVGLCLSVLGVLFMRLIRNRSGQQ